MTRLFQPDPDQPLIRLEKVVREVAASKEKIRRLLNGLSWTLQTSQRVAVLARNQGSADAFLECASGICSVQGGNITINVNVSWPLGEPGALPASLSARQNAEFLQQIYGDPRNVHGQMQLIRLLSDLDKDFFDRPMKLYNKYMKARFKLAVSLAFDFDAYIVPRMPAWPYSSKSMQCRRFKEIFEQRIENKPIVVSHPDFNFQKAYCDTGIILEDGGIAYQGDLASCHEQFTSKNKQKKP